MLILALDSTATAASAAITEGDRLLALSQLNRGNTHSESLLPMIEAMFARLEKTAADIDLFACSVGPGSFTGVRIGAATIKGLAFGREKPCAAVSTLEALAQNLVGAAPAGALLCPVMNARRAQVYNALFRAPDTPDAPPVRLTPDRALSAAALEEELAAMGEFPVWLVGDGIEVVRDAAVEVSRFIAAPPLLREQNACSVARCAWRMAQRGDTVSDMALAPVYLRPCQAERERAERLAAEKKG